MHEQKVGREVTQLVDYRCEPCRAIDYDPRERQVQFDEHRFCTPESRCVPESYRGWPATCDHLTIGPMKDGWNFTYTRCNAPCKPMGRCEQHEVKYANA